MKNRNLISLSGIAALAAVLAIVASQAGAATVPSLRPLCTVGPIRCQLMQRTDVPIVADATAAHSGLGAPDLRAAYNLAAAAATKGGNQTVALVDAYDDPTIESDLNVYRAYYGIPPCTTANGCFRKVNQDGEQGSYPIANPQWDPEIALDTEMVSAICPKCHILLVEANSADETAVMSNPVQHSDLGASVDTARPRSRTATAPSDRSRTKRSGTTTTTIPASRSPPAPVIRTTARSGRRRRRT